MKGSHVKNYYMRVQEEGMRVEEEFVLILLVCKFGFSPDKACIVKFG